MVLSAGTRLGPYVIESALGAGGMGEVYRAHDTDLRRHVAIKILPGAFAADPERLARFEREAWLLAALNHAHIGAIYGIASSDGIRGLVLELIEGETLAARLRRGPLPATEAVAVARQLADALDAAHAKGIIHRDLKPANISITHEGVVKVLDFGLAKLVSEDGPLDATRASTPTLAATGAGVVLGTAAYMSPEQARGQPVDRRTDVWAFGCVLFEMLAGRAAFARPTLSDTMVAILEREPDWPALPDSTPLAVRSLLRQCLEKDARRRRRDIGDVRIELESLGAQVSEAPPPGRLPTPGRAVWALAGAAAALSAAALAYLVRPHDAPLAFRLSVPPPQGTTFPVGSGAPWPSVSPDGRHLAFVALTTDLRQHLWIRPLDSTTSRRLDGTEGAARPFWSPDSRSIAYFANGKLWRLDLVGGAPRVVCDAPYQGGLAGTWGPDDNILFNNSGLYLVPAGGGRPELITDRDEMRPHLNPTLLPDGRRYLFHMASRDEQPARICAAELGSQHATCIVDVDSPARYASGFLLFVRDRVLNAQRFDAGTLATIGSPVPIGDTLVNVEPSFQPPPFSASANDVLAYHPAFDETQPAWVDRSGRRLGPALAVDQYEGMALSDDDARIAAHRVDPDTGNVDLWLHDLGRRTSSRFTFDEAVDSNAVFSADGRYVAFSSRRGGRVRLMMKPTSGDGREEMLLESAEGLNASDWSSDARFIAYMVFTIETGWDVWALPLSADREPVPVARTEHGERAPQFSPDGRWIAYDSTESGRREIWIQPFPPTGSRWQISAAGGVNPHWGGGGRELYYVAADGRLMAVGLTFGAAPEIDTPTPLFQTTSSGGAYASYAPSRDGRRFLVALPPGPGDVQPITVVVNWTALLAAR